MPSRGKAQKRRATMRLVYVDFWSALKMSFLVSIIVAASLLLWSSSDHSSRLATTVMASLLLWSSSDHSSRLAITVVASLLLWSLLDRFGVVASASTFLEDIAGAQGANLVAGLTFPNVMTFTLVVALLEVIVVSALGAIFAALFNLAVHVVGGWKVTFGSD